jgi:hypothetical protein
MAIVLAVIGMLAGAVAAIAANDAAERAPAPAITLGACTDGATADCDADAALVERTTDAEEPGERILDFHSRIVVGAAPAFFPRSNGVRCRSVLEKFTTPVALRFAPIPRSGAFSVASRLLTCPLGPVHGREIERRASRSSAVQRPRRRHRRR